MQRAPAHDENKGWDYTSLVIAMLCGLMILMVGLALGAASW